MTGGAEGAPRWARTSRTNKVRLVAGAGRWADLGEYLARRRKELGLRRRDAARAAGIDESTWRALEDGFRQSGQIRVLPSPSYEQLRAIAEALDVPLQELLQHAGPVTPPRLHQAEGAEQDLLAVRIRQLPDDDRRLIEEIVDRLLAPRTHEAGEQEHD